MATLNRVRSTWRWLRWDVSMFESVWNDEKKKIFFWAQLSCAPWISQRDDPIFFFDWKLYNFPRIDKRQWRLKSEKYPLNCAYFHDFYKISIEKCDDDDILCTQKKRMAPINFLFLSLSLITQPLTQLITYLY